MSTVTSHTYLIRDVMYSLSDMMMDWFIKKFIDRK